MVIWNYRAHNLIEQRKYNRKYRKKNRERLNKLSREYYQKNKKAIKERKKKYRQRPEVKARNKVRKKEYWKRQDVKNRRKVRSKLAFKDRYYTDKSYNIKHRISSLVLHALRRFSMLGKVGTSSKYGINYELIIKHLKPFPKEIKNYHVDHIIPLSLFDFNNPEHIKRAFAPENHQWLTIQQNLEKGDRLIMPH